MTISSCCRVAVRGLPARMVVRAMASSTKKGNPPAPRRFYVAPDKLVETVTSAAGFLTRGTSGALCSGYAVSIVDDKQEAYSVARFAGKMVQESSVVSTYPRPAKPLLIYEFEGCPFCKKVREMMTHLDLDCVYYPCPRDGPNWRPKAIATGGKKQFPYLQDPNTGVSMYESDDIINYLASAYGDGTVPLALRMGPLTGFLCGLSLIPRGGAGSMYRPSKVTESTIPLEYYGYEASPFCKIVRSTLCELEVPHVWYSCARGSPKRQAFQEARGIFQVPYLEDPNTGMKSFESSFLVEYLEETYARTKKE